MQRTAYQKKMKGLAGFINSQIEKIMLSKMNSDVQAVYIKGHNKFEGTVRD